MRRTLIVLLIAAILATAASSDADASQEAEERLPTASDAYTFDSPVRDMKWVKDDKGKPTIVLLQTSEGYVHKSVDSGRNWQSLGDLFKPTAVALPAKPKGLLGHAKIKTAGKEHLIQKMYAPSNLRSIYFRPLTCFVVLSLLLTLRPGICHRLTAPWDSSSPSLEQCTRQPIASTRSPRGQLPA
jgi:hypothetical protein